MAAQSITSPFTEAAVADERQSRVADKVSTVDADPSTANDGTDVTDITRYPFVGTHFLASYVNCDPVRLLDQTALIAALKEAIEGAGATVLNTCEQRFPNGGLTAIFLLAESHASVHTYPEHASCFVDFFTCGANCDSTKFDTIFNRYISVGTVDTKGYPSHGLSSGNFVRRGHPPRRLSAS